LNNELNLKTIQVSQRSVLGFKKRKNMTLTFFGQLKPAVYIAPLITDLGISELNWI